MRTSLIIAAGGSGLRFWKGMPRPVLAHTLGAFRDIPEVGEVILALPR
jgi:hypothetical protein